MLFRVIIMLRLNLHELLHSLNVRLHLDTVFLLLVLRQMIALDKALATHITLVPFTRMPTHVRLHIVALRKALVAMRTLVRSLTRMHAHMHEQVVGTIETLAAGRAQMGLLTGVIAFVNGQIGGPRKAFAAEFAFVGFVAFVASHVNG